MGNSQATHKCYVAASNGDVVKTRAIVRVVEGSRWSKEAIGGIKGTPMNLRPQHISDSDDFLEESASPHVSDDQTGEDDDAVIGPADVSKLDKQLRITLKDLQDFGYSDKCPRCSDLQKGIFKTKRNHSTDCRMRIYLAYKDHDHPKWRAAKHLFEDPTDQPLHKGNIDAEGSSSTPKALFEDSVPNAASDEANHIGHDGRDAESILADEAAQVAFNDEDNATPKFQGDSEMDVADLFYDPVDADMMDPVA